jgi:hypothetical protein
MFNQEAEQVDFCFTPINLTIIRCNLFTQSSKMLVWFVFMLLVSITFSIATFWVHKVKSGQTISFTKKAFCIFLFLFSFTPSATVFFLAGYYQALFWIQVTYFFTVWTLFHLARETTSERIAAFVPIFFGLLLCVPSSIFVEMQGEQFRLRWPTDLIKQLSISANLPSGIYVIFHLVICILPLAGVQYLMRLNDD